MLTRAPLRFAGNKVVGIDLPAALMMAEALGYDTTALAELLPAAEAGMLDGMRKNTNG